jgi:hypothetical protein
MVESSIVKKIGLKKEIKVITLKNKFLKHILFAAQASIALSLSINYLSPLSAKEINFDSLGCIDIKN